MVYQLIYLLKLILIYLMYLYLQFIILLIIIKQFYYNDLHKVLLFFKEYILIF